LQGINVNLPSLERLFMRYMGLDVGDATIGIALSDSMGIIAQGRENYRRVSVKEDIDHVINFVVDEDVRVIVVGLPLNMNGTKGPQAEKVELLVKQLKKKIKYSDRVSHDVELVLWDERLSTVQAERMMIDADFSRAKRKTMIDKMAAIVILQSYLDKEGNTL